MTASGDSLPREEREYVLGTDDGELQRLGFQHRLWSASALALWERAGLGPGWSVLDVGCGPGYATVDLARLVGPAGRVLAIDASARFVAHLEHECRRLGLGGVETRVDDVQTMAVAGASIDLAYARWVLCFVADPAAVIATVAAALRPGGRFAVQDYVRYGAATFAPRTAALDRVIAATEASWRQSGGDPDVGSRLPALMAQHGLRVEEVRPLVRVGRPGSMLWEWPRSFFGLYVPRLRDSGHLTAADAEAFWRAFEAHAVAPGAFFVTPPMVEVIAVKP